MIEDLYLDPKSFKTMNIEDLYKDSNHAVMVVDKYIHVLYYFNSNNSKYNVRIIIK
jgi:hypothetical protein